MRKTIIASFLVICATITIVGHADAQSSCVINVSTSGCSGGFSSHKGLTSGTGGGLDHSVCWSCYVGGFPDSPEKCHSCGFIEAEECDDYAALLSAVETGTKAKIFALAAKLPRYIQVNDERSVLQIRACNSDGIIAQVPLNWVEVAQLQVFMTGGRYASSAIPVRGRGQGSGPRALTR